MRESYVVSLAAEAQSLLQELVRKGLVEEFRRNFDRINQALARLGYGTIGDDGKSVSPPRKDQS